MEAATRPRGRVTALRHCATALPSAQARQKARSVTGDEASTGVHRRAPPRRRCGHRLAQPPRPLTARQDSAPSSRRPAEPRQPLPAADPAAGAPRRGGAGHARERQGQARRRARRARPSPARRRNTQFVRVPARQDRPGLHDPVGVRRRLAARPRPARCQRDPGSRTAPPTTRRTGCPTSTRRTSTSCSTARASRSRTTTSRSPVVATPRSTTSQDWVDRARQRGVLRRQRRTRTRAAPGTSSPTPPTPGTPPRRRSRQVRRRDQRLPADPSTSGTATTTTVTATSTSPTATSTTSRPSTPVRARRPAAAPRAPTPSGRTAGTSTRTTSATPARVDGPRTYGGTRIGTTDFWIGDYTVEPENGGLGVFAHEYGHDLGLPDFYDTNGGDNGTAFWSVMSSGSLARPRRTRASARPPAASARRRSSYLGWLDYTEVNQGQTSPRSSARRRTPMTTRAPSRTSPTRRSRSTCPARRPRPSTPLRPRAVMPGGRVATTASTTR